MSTQRKTILFFQTGSPVLARRKLAGVSSYARERGWRIISLEKYGGPFDVAAQVRAVKADGIIAECSGPHDEFSPRALCRIPHVFLCRDPEEIGSALACVSNDSSAIGHLAAETLLPVAHSFLFVGWYESVYWSDRKRDAFCAMLRTAGKPSEVFAMKPAERRNSLRLQRRLADRLAHLPPPIGLFAVCDEIGLVAENAAIQAGLKIGKEISILAANDDETLCESGATPLASIHLDYEQTGRIAAQVLDAAFCGKPQDVRFFSVPPIQVHRRSSLARCVAGDDEIEQALKFIEQHATEGITPADVVRKFSCSRRPAEIRFKSKTGQTFAEAIVGTRLAAAQRLLAHGNVKIAAVSARCGWRSETLFHRQFKAATGLSPLSWRKRWDCRHC